MKYMHPANSNIDIILDILKGVLKEQPQSAFTTSLYNQYCERGSLSKKQLEGLYSKASKLKGIPQGKLATLQAIILKKPTRYKSLLPATVEETTVKEDSTGNLIKDILIKYPQHKRLLFLKSKLENREILSQAEVEEIQKFGKLLL